MGCKNCKDKKSLVNDKSIMGDSPTNTKFIFILLGITFIIVPWIMGANQLFQIVKDFILSLF